MGAPIKTFNSFNPVASDDDNDNDDDQDTEEKVLDSLKTWANQVSHANNLKLSQKQRRKLKPFEPKPLTKEQILAISEQVNAGKLNLPILEQCSDANYRAIWNLVDSGSAADVANHKKHFPGATVTVSEAQKKGQTFTAANGSPIENKGEMSFPVRYEEGNEEVVTWQNADVELPIRSTKKMAAGKKRLCYGEESGIVINPDTGIHNRFVSAHGVYFINTRS